MLVTALYESGHEWTEEQHQQVNRVNLICARAKGGA